MIEGLGGYSAYRASGVDWVAQVPTHWRTLTNHRIFRETTRPYAGTPEVQLSLSQRQGLVPKALMEARSMQTASFDNWKIVLPDDVVCNRFKAHLGVFFAATRRGIVTFHYGVFCPKVAVVPKYFELLFHTPAYCGIYAGRSNGMTVGLQNLSNQNFYAVPSLVPPLDEQAAIVRFLDHADRRIRRYIRAKQQLIKLLEEQKRAIIHHAVTRGLDPNVRLKPSGVDWLGDVPEHWSVAALRYRYSQLLGKMLDSKRITGAKLVPYLRNTDVQWDRINTVELPMMDIDLAEYERYTVRVGDLLVCEGGEVGRCAIWNGGVETCGFQKALHRLRPRRPERDSPRYMYYQLQAATRFGAFDDGHRSTIAHLTGDKLRAHRFAFPPATEQEQIVMLLDGRCSQSDSIADRTRFEITLLREYRTRLFSDVLTGQLDVRAAAAALPDEPSDADPLDDAEPQDEDNLDDTEATPEADEG